MDQLGIIKYLTEIKSVLKYFPRGVHFKPRDAGFIPAFGGKEGPLCGGTRPCGRSTPPSLTVLSSIPFVRAELLRRGTEGRGVKVFIVALWLYCCYFS
jgi:hypothetical protein